MKITKWDEQAAEDIGHAFGYYDYGQETGMGVFYSSKEAVANYIAGYVRMAFEGQMLYATSERGEGYIAYTLPGQKMNFKAGMAILKALFRNMSLKEMIRMGKALSKGGRSLQDRMKKEKKKFIFVGMVCVREQYQGQGYMRKVLDMAFSEGNRNLQYWNCCLKIRSRCLARRIYSNMRGMSHIWVKQRPWMCI